MDRAEQESWREKVKLCAVAIGLIPVSPYGDMGWAVKEYEQASMEIFYYPLASDTQAMYLIKAFGLCIQSQARSRRIGNTTKSFPYNRWRVREHEWYGDLNKAVVAYVAAHPELRPGQVRTSVPTR